MANDLTAAQDLFELESLRPLAGVERCCAAAIWSAGAPRSRVTATCCPGSQNAIGRVSAALLHHAMSMMSALFAMLDRARASSGKALIEATGITPNDRRMQGHFL